jgi:hypothetical protein
VKTFPQVNCSSKVGKQLFSLILEEKFSIIRKNPKKAFFMSTCVPVFEVLSPLQ